jgi:ABC-2 type transport system ATP-binding protein
MDTVIEVSNLQKRYGDLTAVRDVTFTVGRGEVFGLLGPNGAGKTTTVEILVGLRRRDGGEVRVLGLDPTGEGRALRPRIGVQLQSAVLPDRLTVGEAITLFASFYGRTVDHGALLERWGLADKRRTAFKDLSGGQRQRLFILLALLHEPEVVFLDELTTGLDPQARRATWDLLRELRGEGVTVVLVTHDMEEAATLCDRVAIVDHGSVVALDTPAELVARLGGAPVPVAAPPAPSLDDVFLSITGRTIRD